MQAIRALLIAGLLLAAAPSLACDNYPGLPPLPGETVEATKARNDRLWESNAIIMEYQGQQRSMKRASEIYVARVIKRDQAGNGLLSVEVEPVYKLKGQLPKKHRLLSDIGLSSCGSWGGGEATSSRPGDWVIVFTGLPKTKTNPQGVDSVRAGSALVYDLVQGIERFSYSHQPDRGSASK